MIDKDFLTIEEAREWLNARGFKRSIVWFRKMIYRKRNGIESEIKYGRSVISIQELKRILKDQPKLKVVVSVFLLCLLFNSKLFAVAPKWEGVVVHHSESTHMTLGECNAWHRARGWESCRYNFIIEPDGTLV